jgi:hypothetical protein
MKLRPLVLLTPLLLGLPCALQAQLLPEPTEGIDDYVVVNGWRHPVQLRMAMVDAELAVYDLFNNLNDDHSLTLQCFTRSVANTRLQTTDCAPRFESAAQQLEGQNMFESYREMLNGVAITEGNFSTVMPGRSNLEGGDQLSRGEAGPGLNPNLQPYVNYTPTAAGMPAHLAIKAGQNRLQHKMEEIAATHPEFVEAVVHYVQAKERYTESLRRVD